jgi:DNA-binding response OmpR family regulator
LSTETYGVVLLDIALPGGNPEDVVEVIAALSHEARPVVLVMASNPLSGRTLDVDVVQIVLRKPIGLRQTVALIESCLRNASAVRTASAEDGDHATS